MARAASALAALALTLALAGAAQTPAYRYIRSGAPAPRAGAPRGGFALLGGGTDLDQAFQWMCQRSGGGDFLILRASGTDAYNPYVARLCPGENSVATLILPSRAAALDPFATQTIAQASAIFIAGGDQANYINFWTGTPVERALNAAIGRGVPLGGTSAGLAVLGEFVYSAQNDGPKSSNLTSAAALANPFDRQVVWVRAFVSIPALRGVLTDTHFHNRNRLGRLLVLLARLRAAGAPAPIHGLGVDQHTAVLLEPGGQAVVAGTGAAYFFSAAAAPSTCLPGQPLSWAAVAVRRLRAGQSFDFTGWSGAGTAYRLRVVEGVIHSSQPTDAIY